MILIDSRVGSRHYADLLGERSTLTLLESGDACFGSNGVTVGCEIKRVLDAVNCMYSGRLADTQIPTLRQQYDVCYLIIEGLYQPEPESGILQYYKGELGKWGHWHDAHSGIKRIMYSQFVQWLTTMEQQGGVLLRHSVTPETTAALLLALEVWWSRDDHKSFRVMQERGEAAALSRPGMLRRMLAEIPHVGWERSGILQRRFTGVHFTPGGDNPESWLIERQIALPTATKIIETLNGES